MRGRARLLVAGAIVVAAGSVVGIGIGGALRTTSDITAGRVRSACSSVVAHYRSVPRIQLFGSQGTEESLGTRSGAFCVADTSFSEGSWQVDLRPSNGALRVVYSGVADGDFSFIVTSPAIEAVEVAHPGVQVKRVSSDLWVIHVPGNYSNEVTLQGPKFDIAVASGVDRNGSVVGFSPIYLCPQQTEVILNACI